LCRRGLRVANPPAVIFVVIALYDAGALVDVIDPNVRRIAGVPIDGAVACVVLQVDLAHVKEEGELHAEVGVAAGKGEVVDVHVHHGEDVFGGLL
jgi:hypothetical protein